MTTDDRTNAADQEAARIDARFRRGLEPGPETVARVVRRSLRDGSSARPRRLPLVAATSAAAIVLAAAILYFLPREGEREAGTRTDRLEPSAEILTITNATGKIEVLYPAGSSTGGVATEDGNHQSREVIIVNSDGIVAAIVPAPISHNFILGGES